MFYQLKRSARELLLLIAFIFIGGIFLWNYSTKVSLDTVLVVNGRKVPYEDYQRILIRELERARENKEKELTEKEKNIIKRNILSSLVQEQLLLEEADKLGIDVSDEIVANTIASFPQFQRDGKFDIRLYYDFLRYYYRTTPEEFEKEIKNSIKTRMIRRILFQSVKVTDEELKREFERRYPDKSFEGEKEKFKKELLNERMNMLYYEWMNEQFQRAKIINNLPRIEKISG